MNCKCDKKFGCNRGYKYSDEYKPVYGPGYYGPICTADADDDNNCTEHFGRNMPTRSIPTGPIRTPPYRGGYNPNKPIRFAPQYDPTYISTQPVIIQQQPVHVPQPTEYESSALVLGVPCCVCCMILILLLASKQI